MDRRGGEHVQVAEKKGGGEREADGCEGVIERCIAVSK